MIIRGSMKEKNKATLFAFLAAALYAINIPLSKILLNYVEPTMMVCNLFSNNCKYSIDL